MTPPPVRPTGWTRLRFLLRRMSRPSRRLSRSRMRHPRSLRRPSQRSQPGADLTRLIIGLAILSNATVIFSAFLRASLSASPDNLAGQLLMQYWPQLWVGLEWGVGGVSYWWGRYLYRSKLNCLWGLSLIELSILVLIHAPYMCVPQVQH